jgi:hypothetical protein
MPATTTKKKATSRKGAKSAKAAKAAPAKKGRTRKTNAEASANGKAKKTSAIDAAAKVLAEAEAPMNTKQMIEAMSAKRLWKSPGGKTPHATLYSAILREIATKGREARFKKAERGKFKISS